MTLFNSALRGLAHRLWVSNCMPSALAFERALQDPQRSQSRLLHRILGENDGTEYGRRYGFSKIQSITEFQNRVPIVSYDELESLIERVAQGNDGVLTREPVSRLVPSSGSTAARKLIPFTASLKREMNRAIGPWIWKLFATNPQLLNGASYWSISPSIPPDHASVIPIGFEDDTEYLHPLLRTFAEATLAVPQPIRQVRNYSDFRYLTCLYLLRCQDLAFISIWHPTYLLLLLDELERRWEELLRDVHDGTLAGVAEPDALPSQFKTCLPLPRRAKSLERAPSRDVAAIWPGLSCISTWSHGNAVRDFRLLQGRCSDISFQSKGLLATEGIITIPWGSQHPLAIRSHFLEFEDSQGRIFCAHELTLGEEYEVILTTGGGLYRYRLGDRIRVKGWVGKTPEIEFLSKTSAISDLVGEKISGSFAANVMDRLAATGTPRLALLVANTSDHPPRYTLLSDLYDTELEGQLESLLLENPHYAHCRGLGQLERATIRRVPPESKERYLEWKTRNGASLGDIKPSALEQDAEVINVLS